MYINIIPTSTMRIYMIYEVSVLLNILNYFVEILPFICSHCTLITSIQLKKFKFGHFTS